MTATMNSHILPLIQDCTSNLDLLPILTDALTDECENSTLTTLTLIPHIYHLRTLCDPSLDLTRLAISSIELLQALPVVNLPIITVKSWDAGRDSSSFDGIVELYSPDHDDLGGRTGSRLGIWINNNTLHWVTRPWDCFPDLGWRRWNILPEAKPDKQLLRKYLLKAILLELKNLYATN